MKRMSEKTKAVLLCIASFVLAGCLLAIGHPIGCAIFVVVGFVAWRVAATTKQ